MRRILLHKLIATFSLFFWSMVSAPMLYAADQGSIEEVVVTGTYIKGTPEDAALPVTTLHREDLAFEGSPTAIDLIKSMSFSQGADGETDQFQAGAGADRATINIRGLGPSRSLVLVNGRRTTWSPFAIGAQAQLLVDVNMLPAIALQRIEVLRDGAAATYGSDAIAGVMNFITRGDYEGFEISASHKDIEDTAGDQEFGVIFGKSFLDGRAHIMSSASYIKRDQLRIADRDWSLLSYDENTRGGWSSVGRPSVLVPLDRFAATAGGFGGLLDAGIVDPNCEALGGARTNTPAGNPEGGFCRFQYTAFDNLIEDAERWQWFTEAHFELNETTNLTMEFLLTDSDVPNWGTSPSYPPNRLVDANRTVRANNPGLVDMASRYPGTYGEFASCAEVYCQWAGDGGAQDLAGVPAAWQETAWFYGRYYGQDGPPRSHHRQSELMRFAAVLDGQWDEIGWQVSATYSESKRESGRGDTMVYRDQRARQGLGGFDCEAQVPNEFDGDSNLDFSLATLQEHAGQGPCQYWIPFSNSMAGANSLVPNGIADNPDFNPALDNQAIRDYMMTTGVDKGETSLLVVEGILTGEFSAFEMPAGTIDYAFGFQYRDETYETGIKGFYDGVEFPCQAGPEIKDCSTGRTGLFGFLPPNFAIDEDRDIWAAFAEFHVPITETLEAQISIRHEDYGGATGSTTDPKIALRWQITDSIGIRGSFGSTFRGPTLNQIVSGNSSNSLQFVGATGAFKRIDTRGNPDLEPEEADTINVGFLVDHDDLITDGDNLFITLDFWSYDFTKPLVTEPFTNIVTLACPGGGACDPTSEFFDRLVFGGGTSATDIEIINVNIVNGPDYKTDGIDFTFRYGMEVGPGYLTANISGTKILSYDIDGWQFGPKYDALGRLNYRTSLARTVAEWKARGSLNYEWENLNVRWITNFLDDYDYAGAAPQPAGDATVATHVTHDIHFTYAFMEGRLTATGSIINIEDDDPGYVSREFNYDAFSHNPFGRMFKVGLSYSLN